ncbi:hypothetical protein BsWGS_04409 [Bradybaena similaris]
MEASMNGRAVTVTRAARNDNPRNNHTNKITSALDDDGHAKVLSQGQSFNYKECTFACNTLSRQNSTHKNWLNKLVLFFHILFAFHILSLPAVQAEISCQKRPAIHTIRYLSCIPKTLLVPVCLGNCSSYSMTDFQNLTSIQRECSCCQATEFVGRNVEMRCPRSDGAVGYENAVIVMKVPVACMCRPCAPLPVIESAEAS